jgi:ATP-dependent Clp protease, protease subunit
MPWRLTPLAAGEVVELIIHAPIGETWDGDGVSSRHVIEALNKVPRAKEIRTFINSPGGDAFEGMAIYSALSRHQAKVTVEIDGTAASAASIIAMAGDTIRIAEAGFFMIHNPFTLAMGTAADMRKMADDLERVGASMRDVYVARTGQAAEAVTAALDAETWFSGNEAVAWGLATEVMPNKRAAACVFPPQLRAAFHRLPQALATGQAVTPPPARASGSVMDKAAARMDAVLAAHRAKRAGVPL